MDLLNISISNVTLLKNSLAYKQIISRGIIDNQQRRILKKANNKFNKLLKSTNHPFKNSNHNLKFKSSIISSSALSTENASVAEPPMKILTVDLGPRSYPIYIGTGLLDKGELLCKHINGKHVLIVTNETIAPLYLEK